jgi:ABC-type nitrate/sulfonate/bicarbonate transport system substrate-binding protein
VQSFDVPTGVKSKEAIVDGNAMMGVCSPNAISITDDAQLAKLRILGSVMQSSSTVAIVARKPLNELPMQKIGFVPGAISEFYLIAYLQKAGLLDLYRDKRLSLTALPPPGLTTALAKRDVDAIVAWEPFAAQGEAALRSAGEPVFVARDETLYTQHILIVADSAADPTAVDKVVAALRRTCENVTANRAAAAAELEKYFKFPPGYLLKSAVWSKVAFEFSADKSLIQSALARDLELARIAGIAKASEKQFATLLSKLA